MHPNVSVWPRLATVTAPRTHDLDIIPDDAYDDGVRKTAASRCGLGCNLQLEPVRNNLPWHPSRVGYDYACVSVGWYRRGFSLHLGATLAM